MKMKHFNKKSILIVATILLFLVSMLSSFNKTAYKAEAELDPASGLICKFGDGKDLVNFYSTDYFYFLFRSKSAVTTSQDVNSIWLNKLLTLSGSKFEKTNSSILGRPTEPSSLPDDPAEDANKKAPKVSAFDRFGVAGLKWSSYQGEWKYYQVDACATGESVSPTTYGSFYEGRLEPQSTHNDTINSLDVRSIQFNKGLGATLLTAFTDTLSNAMFAITKTIVTLTIVFVGLSFTDITSLLGMLDETGKSGPSASGIFKDLFNGLFSGFIILTFVFTAIYIFYKAVFKREMRFAINTLLKTILIFVIAIIMASNPAYWIGFPNKVATYGQALVLSSMSGIYKDETKSNLCKTDVASIDEGVEFNFKKPESFKDEFEKTNENMRSMISCQMWETLLFKPWARGQFGAEYEELDNKKLKNNNEEWVGDAGVPLGGGVVVKNWALYQLSTQTNAHAATGSNGLPVLVNGVNADWWRIVDALSDYEEEKESETDPDGTKKEFQTVVEKPPTKFWQSWVGNNRTERLGVAFTSIVFGIFGSLAPLVFALASAIFGLGITLLMMVSPIFLLFGTWGGRGQSIFLGWLSALLNTIMKKLGAGLLLILSLAMSMTIMDMIGDVGFVTSLILMVVVSSLLIKNKDKLLDIMASINFGGAFDPRTKANQIFRGTKTAAKETGKVGLAAAGGGITAAQSGQSIVKGVRTGAQRQLMNKLYSSNVGVHTVMQSEMTKGGENLKNHTCVECLTPLGVKGKEIAYRDNTGNYYCKTCSDEIGLEKLYQVNVGVQGNEKEITKRLLNGVRDTAPVTSDDIRTIDATAGRSWMSHGTMREQMDAKIVNGEYVWDNDQVQKAIRNNLIRLNEDYVVFSNIQMKLGRRSNPPSPPEPLHEYIDLALINAAWNDRRFDVVQATYKEAWKMWYEDNGQHIDGMTPEIIEEFKNKIDNFEHEIPEQNARDLMNEYLNDKKTGSSTKMEDNSIYTYQDGKLVLRNSDTQKSNENLSNQ